MLVVSKICSAVLLAVLRLTAGLIPLTVYRKLEKWGNKGPDERTGNRRKKRVDLFLSIFLCFGAGLLLSTCFIHMIPEVRNSFILASKAGDWPFLVSYPFAETIICVGFFAVYLLEELGERLASRGNKKKAKILPDAIPGDPLSSESFLEKQSDHHGHSHAPVSDEDANSVAAAIRGFLLVAALSFHSIFEGMAIGLQPTVNDVWFLFTAVLIHELAIMFCIGMEMLASRLRLLLYVSYMVELGLITSVGVAIGILVTEYVHDPSPLHLLIIAILQGVAAGTLLYVTFLEVLERERSKPGNGLLKLMAIVIGFILLSGMEALGGHDPLTSTTLVSELVLPISNFTDEASLPDSSTSSPDLRNSLSLYTLLNITTNE